MSNFSQNLIQNGGMHTDTLWAKNATAPATVTFENDGYRLISPDGSSCDLQQTLPGSLIGHPARVYFYATKVIGSIKCNLGGTENTYSQGGLIVMHVDNVINTVFAFTRGGVMNWHVTWAYVVREDAQMARLELKMRDFDGDYKQFSVDVRAVTDGASWSLADSDMDDVKAKLAVVMVGNVAEDRRVYEISADNDTNAANAYAQTHLRIIIQYYDSVTDDGPYELAVPTADVGDNSLWLPNMHADLTNSDWTDLVTSLETYMKNPRTGNAVTIGDIFLEE